VVEDRIIGGGCRGNERGDTAADVVEWILIKLVKLGIGILIVILVPILVIVPALLVVHAVPGHVCGVPVRTAKRPRGSTPHDGPRDAQPATVHARTPKVRSRLGMPSQVRQLARGHQAKSRSLLPRPR
jgi:hypothetical protein